MRQHAEGMNLSLPRSALLLPVLLLLLVVPSAAAAAPVPTLEVGAWRWPLQPAPPIVRRFEPTAGPYGAGHRGVDLLGAPGEPVLAVADGTVTFSGSVAGRGVVVVDHGNERSTYLPLAPLVRRSHEVSAGEVIGTLELAGSHCLPSACLHLGRIAGDVYLDPLELLGGNPVRLLPMTPPLPRQAGVAATGTGTRTSTGTGLPQALRRAAALGMAGR